MAFLYKGSIHDIPQVKCWYPQAIVYDPIKAGSLDSTDIEAHDAAILRAVKSKYKPSYKACGNPLNTIFIGKLSLDTTEKDLEYVRIIGLPSLIIILYFFDHTLFSFKL